MNLLYLRKMEINAPDRVENLRKMVNLDEIMPSKKQQIPNGNQKPSTSRQEESTSAPPIIEKVSKEKIFDSDDDDDH